MCLWSHWRRGSAHKLATCRHDAWVAIVQVVWDMGSHWSGDKWVVSVPFNSTAAVEVVYGAGLRYRSSPAPVVWQTLLWKTGNFPPALLERLGVIVCTPSPLNGLTFQAAGGFIYSAVRAIKLAWHHWTNSTRRDVLQGNSSYDYIRTPFWKVVMIEVSNALN